jgi:HEAT repeat protein
MKSVALTVLLLLAVLSAPLLARRSRPIAELAAHRSSSMAVALQEKGPQPVSAADLKAAIGKLGNLDYPIRSAAARLVRRTPPAQAVPALLDAVSSHPDGYVRFKALVLLAGFNDPRARDAMDESSNDANDRLREVAYAYFEHHPEPTRAPALLKKLDTELAEFVRPGLIRALAALGSLPNVQQALNKEAMRGQDFFRSAVIEALGDYKATYAIDNLIAISKLDGPLQHDAALAMGKIGDKRVLPVLAGLQQSAPRQSQPEIAAAICLLGVNCGSHLGYIADTLRFADKNPGFAELLRGAATGLAAISIKGNEDALRTLLEVGLPSEDPTRAPIALAVATVAIRNTPFMLEQLQKMEHSADTIALIGEGFDMLEEDFEEEQFFATVRRTYWSAPQGSPTRAVAETLIQKLEF